MVRTGLFLMAALAAGCHTVAYAPPVAPPAPQLPTTGRGVVEAEVAANANDPAPPPARPAQYRKLTAAECRTLAIRNAPLAAELDTHPDNEPPHPLHHKRSDLAAVARVARGYAADEMRNRAAADALELYYQLAAAEGQFDLAATAHSQLRVLLTAAEKAVAGGGMAAPAEVDRLRRQLLEVESRAAKLEAGIAAINAGLAGHLGLDPADQTPIWPADPLRVSAETPDVEQSVRTGLQYRPDLNLLRTLSAGEHNGGELSNAVLTSVMPLLATKDPANPVVAMLSTLKKEPTKAESKVHRQLVGLLQTRERQAGAEIRAAAATVRGNRAAAAAKAAEVRNLAAKVAELEKQAAAGVAGAVAELPVARLDLLKLRGELIQAASEWHIADVKLRQAMGLLVRE